MEFKDWIVLIVLLGVGVGGYYWHRRRLFRVGQSWKKLGRRLNGKFESQGDGWIKDPRYRLSCRYKDQELMLDYYTTNQGRSRSYWTRVSIDCPLEVEFKTYQESLFQKIGKQIGFQDITIGHESYDSKFMIKGSDESLLKKVLSPELRRRHLDLPRASISASEGHLRVVHHGLVSDERQCLALMELAILASLGTVAGMASH